MLSCLLAYDASGAVIATLDHVVAKDDAGNVIGLVDFAAHEEADGEHTDLWTVSGAAGSKVWPEWLGGQAQHFRVELIGPPGRKQIGALIHKTSGYRRERAAIEQAILDVPINEHLERDIRHIVGGPDRPLILDDEGRTIGRSVSQGTPAHIPVIGRR